MLKEVHDHITNELSQGARTDTIFVITAIVFNLIVLGINSGIAASANNPYNSGSNVSQDILLVVFMILLLLVNGIAIIALSVGKQTRQKLLNGLVEMYKDNEVDKYYDLDLLGNYNMRYLLFTGVILCLGITAVIVPLIIRLVN
jgi:magnesium-transporting ATPase (P-type)